MTDNDRVPPRDSAPGEEAVASGAAATALGEEAVLNAAVAFAGHVATAAQQASLASGETLAAPLRDAVFRQYLLETATLCLRRLGEAYRAAGDDAQSSVAALLRDGAAQAEQATTTVEALGDLSLDILDRLLGDAQ